MPEYKITQRILKIWQTRFGEIPRCRLCNVRFKLDDIVSSKKGYGLTRLKGRLYHKSCLDEGSVPRDEFLKS